MISPDRVDQVADSILEPARKELRARQEKQAARENAASRAIQSSLLPAWTASAAAVASLHYLENAVYAIGIGTAVGWLFGFAARRRSQQEPGE